jgi:hypothetical protein
MDQDQDPSIPSKNIKKAFDSCRFVTSFLSLKIDANVPSKSNKQKTVIA